MTLNFSKMHGLGNDFIIINSIKEQFQPSKELIRRLADRHFGIGCDQLLLIEPADTSNVDNVDVYYRIFNADGREVEQCGNGARCVARYAFDRGLVKTKEFTMATISGRMGAVILPDQQVRVNMGIPSLEPASLPFKVHKQAKQYRLVLDGEAVTIGAVAIGNPHAVVQVADIQQAPVATLGPLIEGHHLFPNHVNVGFMQIVDPQHVNLRVYERGAGETLACGSGACAAVAIGKIQELLGNEVEVNLKGGKLIISWLNLNEPIWLTGPAEYVFEGQYL